jgi:diaminohydroxyphosphoribosylaminopyrimidine deaminase / 5-amino-6-(5-phosphoribosylamino)uracil reductase
MMNHEQFMRRCIDLARNGAGNVAPNPMVGCVIVHDGKIIGEGYHAVYGGPHAEVNAVQSVKNPGLLRKSTLYVSLEPCAHHGKTPPCSALILKMNIPHVVVGSSDPYAEVSGRGIARLMQGGVTVETGILEPECRWLNRRFFTFHEKKRPYIILKWAQTLDGFIAPESASGKPVWISGTLARMLVHRMRTEESAILTGTGTVLKDNPSLTARDWCGKSPVRAIIDRTGKIPHHYQVFNQEVSTLLFTGNAYMQIPGVETCLMDFKQNLPRQIVTELFRRNLQSVIIEGGASTLQHFIDSGLWDEAHIFSGPGMFFRGIKAPEIDGHLADQDLLDDTVLSYIVNRLNVYLP